MGKEHGRTVPIPRMTAVSHHTQIPIDLAFNVLQSGNFPLFQIQNLLMRYHFLDTVSHMKPDAINGRIHTMTADLMARSTVDSLALMYTTSPRPWLKIRKMLQSFNASDILVTLSVLLDAFMYTNDILNAIPSVFALAAGERKLVEAPFYDCIKARKLVMVFLRDHIRAFVHRHIFPNGQAAPGMMNRKANAISHNGTDRIESKAFLAARQNSKDQLAAQIPMMCTFFSLEIFGGLVQFKACEFANFVSGSLPITTLCHLYRSLQQVLLQSTWQSISAAFPLLKDVQSSRRQSSTDDWISKPFPGFWSCKRGFLLWRYPSHSTTDQTDVGSFCLSSFDDIVLIDLTRVYWHVLCRPPLPSVQCEGKISPKASQRLTECRICHNAALGLSNLKRNHRSLLRLLINQSRVAEKSSLNLILRNLETLKSTRLRCKSSRLQNVAIHGSIKTRESTGYQRSESVVEYRPDELKQDSESTLLSAIHARPSTISSVASDGRSNLFPCAMTASTMKAMILKGLRVVGLCEPLLEKGKCRVRWTCVSNPSDTKVCINRTLQRCGRPMFDDFIERRPHAAKNLEKRLNKSATAGSETSQGQMWVTASAAHNVSTVMSASDPQSGKVNILPNTPLRSYEPFSQRRVEDSIDIDSELEPHWLLVCAKPKERPTSLLQLDLCSTSSDKDLYQELRRKCTSLKSKFARILSLKRVQSIRFVQVSGKVCLLISRLCKELVRAAHQRPRRHPQGTGHAPRDPETRIPLPAMRLTPSRG